MAINTKINPVGIDDVIDYIQNLLYANLSWTNYESYARAYKNETNENLMYEVFTSDNDYKEVLIDDRFNATSFFITEDVSTYSERYNTTVSVIFQLNLKDLYPSILHRPDEEAHNDVLLILQDNPKFDIENITKGIRNVYSEIGYGANKFDDLNPYHVFKIDLNVYYEQKCCIDC